MTDVSNKIDVYLEIGQKRAFAGAIDWPGWCRSGRDEEQALQALLEYGPRYAEALGGARLGFKAPARISALKVVERLKGNATTDFGAPDMAPAVDEQAVDEAERKRFEKVLRACWQAFDAATQAAAGRTLRTGPRGGGRDLEKIARHLLESNEAYLGQLGWKAPKNEGRNTASQLERNLQDALAGLAAAAHGEIAARGPRGGLRWTPRYFVRRVAWHVLDHAWEIEERIE
jgi:hypothetical protein